MRALVLAAGALLLAACGTERAVYVPAPTEAPRTASLSLACIDGVNWNVRPDGTLARWGTPC